VRGERVDLAAARWDGGALAHRLPAEGSAGDDPGDLLDGT
jgi:hypothetical protein